MISTLPTYSTFQEKSRVFQVVKIESILELKNYLEEYRNKENFIFRGVNDASYKMLSSMHRVAIEHHINSIRAKREVLFALCEKLFLLPEIRDMFFNSQEGQGEMENSPYGDKAIQSVGEFMIKFGYFLFSLLQHSVSFSPLLDVTRNVDTALFFACLEANCPLPENKVETNEYISVYIINRKYITNNNSLKHFNHIYHTCLDLFRKSIDENEFHWDDFAKQILTNLTFLESIEHIKWDLHLDNKNIEAQEGEFIIYKAYDDEEGAEERYQNVTTHQNQVRYCDLIVSLEINKALMPEIIAGYPENLYFKLFPDSALPLKDKIKTIFDKNIDSLLADAMLPIYS